jgi:hypothetical protein
MGTHEEHVGDHIGNLMGTKREQSENTLGTREKGKKARHLECMTSNIVAVTL